MVRTRHRRPDHDPTADAPYEADASVPSTRAAVTVGYGHSSGPPPPCVICDSAPSDPMQSVMPLALSLDPADATPTALLAVIDHYHAVLADFDELRHAYILARQHNEQLHAAPAAMREIADRFVSFVQRKYDASQARLEDANIRAADAMAAMDRMKDDLRQFETLKIQHDLLRETSAEAYDRLADYAAGLERRIEGRVIDGQLDGSVPKIAQDLSGVRRENADLARHAADHHNQIRSVQASQATTAADLATSRDKCDKLKARLKDLLTHAQKVEASNQQLREDLRAMSGGDSAIQGLRLELHVRGERIRELEGLLDRICAQRNRLQHDFEDANRRADRASGAAERTNAVADRQQAAAQESERQYAAASERIRDLEAQTDELRRERDLHAREHQTIAINFRRSQERLTQANARIGALTNLRSERDALREELNAVTAARDDLQTKNEALQCELDAVRNVSTPAQPVAPTSAPAATAASTAPDPADPAHAPCVRGYRELLVQISDIQQAYGNLRRDFDNLESDFDSLETEHDDLGGVYSTLTEDHAFALERIAQIAALAVVVSPRVAGIRAPRAVPPSTSGPLPPKRTRPSSIGPDLMATPVAKRARRTPPLASPPSVAPPAAGSDSMADLVDDAADEDYVCSDAGTEPSDSDSEESDAEELRVAQARSRSDVRRHNPVRGTTAHSSLVLEGSAAAPIVVGDGDLDEPSGDVDEDASTVDLNDLPAGASTPAGSREEDPGAEDQLVASSASANRSAATADADSVFVPFGPLESFLPGLRQQRAVSAAEAEPWEPSRISLLTMDTVTPRVVIDYQVLTPRWMFPERVGRGGILDRSLYAPGLITRANVEALYAEEPWSALATRPAPFTFDPDVSPQLLSIVDGYLEFENDCLQAIWESTHPFPISKEMKRSDPWFSSFYTSRKNRSSHAREKYRNWQEQGFAKARRTGCCDLDLWLDRMFARFPQQSEDTTWFPGREAIAAGRAAPASLLEALADCDHADPWSNHFRTAPDAHPAVRIDRLRLKFSRA